MIQKAMKADYHGEGIIYVVTTIALGLIKSGKQ